MVENWTTLYNSSDCYIVEKREIVKKSSRDQPQTFCAMLEFSSEIFATVFFAGNIHLDTQKSVFDTDKFKVYRVVLDELFCNKPAKDQNFTLLNNLTERKNFN